MIQNIIIYFRKLDKKFLAISLIHCVITCFGDSLIFSPKNFYLMPNYINIKILVFFAIVAFWQIIHIVIVGFHNKNKKIIDFTHFFLIYLKISC